jgi:CheY-like chemotaxis protein/HPt (histidine-containing phosphotransfer) domain-containing protein
MPDAPAKSVLVIDDTKLVLRFAEDVFRRLRLSVFLASDGYEGLQVALSSRIDLVFLDLMMPRLDGFKTLQVMKSNELTKNIPVVVMTGYSDRINVVSARKLGAAAVITKPLTEEVLLQKLKHVFGDKFVKSIIPSDPKAKENPFGVNEDEYSNIVGGMVADFVKYFGEQVEQLETAVRAEDVETIRKITHDIRGTGGSFGYDEATTLATRLNETVHAARINWQDARELVVQLKNRLKR